MVQFRLRPHLEAISDLHDNIANLKTIAESLPNSTIKGRILANTEHLEQAAEIYTDGTIDLYEKIMNFAIRAAI